MQSKSQKAEISDASGDRGVSGHSPTPWTYESVLSFGEQVLLSEGMEIALVHMSDGLDEPTEIPALANAAFIVRACNSHDNLVKALEEIAALESRVLSRGPELIKRARHIAKCALASSREVRS